MIDNKLPTINIVGTGNVATRMGLALAENGFAVRGVLARSVARGQELASQIEQVSGTACMACTDAQDMPASDVLMFCVSDDAIHQLAQRFAERGKDTVFVHTAGSVFMDVFAGLAGHYGVVYPLQTLSRGRRVDFAQVPLFVEASDVQTETLLLKIACGISQRVQILDSEKRRNLHLSAVFACNFPNALFGIAEKLLADAHVERSMLEPLICETVNKFVERGAIASQTGPAARADKGVMGRQRDMLSQCRDEQAIYDVISQYILNQRSSNE
ncbi:MAG: DUF2520 domain-containing protein [Bacteroidaceae bacterium]|nr:DUF2520 domain-containing protein [Bacteroidaceae bacterium]